MRKLNYHFGSPENKPAHFLPIYERYLAEVTDKEPKILELGVHRGDSLVMLADYFPDGLIMGVDINEIDRDFATPRIKVYQGLQDDPDLFRQITAENSVSSFALIIDDCSHIGSLAAASFEILFPSLKPGGLYIIEDWGAGYWPKWPEGAAFESRVHFRHDNGVFPSHWNGLPGFLKQLVDEVAMPDITSRRGSGEHKPGLLEYVHVYQGIAVIKKKQ